MSVHISIVPSVKPAVQPVARPPLWIHLEDGQISDSSWGGGIRPCASCPAVWVLKDDPHAAMGEQWQYYIRAKNYAMSLENVYLLMDDHLAFANRTGFPSLDNPGDRADFFFRRNMAAKPPNLDKVRTCSLNVLTGTQAYSLMVAMKQTLAAAKNTITRRSSFMAFRQSFTSLLTAQNVLKVTLFDSRQPPPLKPGKSYPSRVEDANIDDYLYNPREHPWMFLVANIVNRRGEVVQFPRGGLYSWTGDNTPRSFMPHVANFEYGEVRYPLSRLRKLGDLEPIPSPYRLQ
jgi:hypothetical protein